MEWWRVSYSGRKPESQFSCTGFEYLIMDCLTLSNLYFLWGGMVGDVWLHCSSLIDLYGKMCSVLEDISSSIVTLVVPEGTFWDALSCFLHILSLLEQLGAFLSKTNFLSALEVQLHLI
jgi:hypothetical protein